MAGCRRQLGLHPAVGLRGDDGGVDGEGSAVRETSQLVHPPTPIASCEILKPVTARCLYLYKHQAVTSLRISQPATSVGGLIFPLVVVLAAGEGVGGGQTLIPYFVAGKARAHSASRSRRSTTTLNKRPPPVGPPAVYMKMESGSDRGAEDGETETE